MNKQIRNTKKSKKLVQDRLNLSKLAINQKTTKVVVLESSNLAQNSGLSTCYNCSKPGGLIKSFSVDNPSVNSVQYQKAVEVEGIEPSDPWLSRFIISRRK